MSHILNLYNNIIHIVCIYGVVRDENSKGQQQNITEHNNIIIYFGSEIKLKSNNCNFVLSYNMIIWDNIIYILYAALYSKPTLHFTFIVLLYYCAYYIKYRNTNKYCTYLFDWKTKQSNK